MVKKKDTFAIFAIILLLAIVIRVVFLFVHQDMWHDASFSVLFAQKSLTSILSSQDVHPPLYYFYLKFMLLFSTNEIFIRSTSLILFAGFMFVLYKFTSKYYGRNVSYITLILVSLSPTMVYYSLEPRNYMLGMLFACAQVYYFLAMFKEAGKSKYYVLFSLLMLYTHYFTGLLLFVETLYILLFKRQHLKLLFKLEYIIVGSIPLLFYFLQSLLKIESMWFKPTTLLGLASTFTFQLFPPDTLTPAILVPVILLAGAMFVFYTQKTQPFLVMCAVIPIITVWLLSLYIPLYHHRFFLFFAFAIYILIAIFIDWFKIPYQYVGMVILVPLLIFGLVRLPATLPTELYESQEILKGQITDYTTIVHTSPFSSTPYSYYFRDEPFVRNILVTNLTDKQLFSAGGAVQEWVFHDDNYSCYKICIYITSGTQIPMGAIEIYNNGGLLIYEKNNSKI